MSWSVALVTVLGSPIYNVLLRMLGAKFEGRAFVLEGEMYDYPFITLSDKAVVDNSPGTSIIGHYVVYNKVTIGPCKVGGIIHEGTFAANALLTSKESGPWRTFIGTYNEQGDSSSISLDLSSKGSKINKDTSSSSEDSFDKSDMV